MFHCDGWTFTWAVTAAMATHVCLRKVDPGLIFPSIRDNNVTHMCGAPIVLNMLANAPADVKVDFPQTVEIATGGAAPPSAGTPLRSSHYDGAPQLFQKADQLRCPAVLPATRFALHNLCA